MSIQKQILVDGDRYGQVVFDRKRSMNAALFITVCLDSCMFAPHIKSAVEEFFKKAAIETLWTKRGEKMALELFVLSGKGMLSPKRYVSKISFLLGKKLARATEDFRNSKDGLKVLEWARNNYTNLDPVALTVLATEYARQFENHANGHSKNLNPIKPTADDLTSELVVMRVDSTQRRIVKLEYGPYEDDLGVYFEAAYIIDDKVRRGARNRLYLNYVGLGHSEEPAKSWLEWPTQEEMKQAEDIFIGEL